MKFLVASLTVFALLTVSCARQDGVTTTPTPVDGVPAAPSPEPNERQAEPLRGLAVERAFPHLSFTQATGLYESPEGRLFVLEQAGRILTFDNRPDVTEAIVWLDIRNRVNSQANEEGLLGFAFAPDYATSGRFYVNYTAISPTRRTVVSRFTALDPAAGPANPASEVVIIEIGQPFSNHNGGQIAFGPDGYLYIGMGDGGASRDPQGHGQNPRTLLGALLRIDVSRGENGRAYSIPADNPFANGVDGRPEIWAFGLRNPWRFAFDPETGDLWLADVGQNQREEVNLIERGGNYGWAAMEGTICSVQSCAGMIAPIHEYQTTGQNCSITGGVLYRGDLYASLYRAYVFGDFCSGRVWALRFDGENVTDYREIVASGAMITSFGQDSRGNLYILDRRGPVLRIVE